MASALGRGLDSLIPQKVKKVTTSTGESVFSVTSDSDQDRILHVSPKLITNNPEQPRKSFNEAQLKELADSIKEYGIIQPLIVTKRGEGYELIAGERRLRASRMLGLETVPVIVREAEEQEKLELALIENVQRAELNPIETAIAYQKLIDEFGLTQEKLSERLGKSRPSIANSLRLLGLPDEIQAALREGRITEGHAKLIAGLDSDDKRRALFKRILNTGLSVSDAAVETRRMGGTRKARIMENPELRPFEQAVQRFFGAKAEIKKRGKGGTIIIHFFSDDEFREIMKKVS